MTQLVFDDIDPLTTSGTQLASKLNDFKDSWLTHNSGTSRPSYVQSGTSWIDTTDASLWVMNLFDGTQDVPVLYIHPNTGTASPVRGAKLVYAADYSSDTIEIGAGGDFASWLDFEAWSKDKWFVDEITVRFLNGQHSIAATMELAHPGFHNVSFTGGAMVGAPTRADFANPVISGDTDTAGWAAARTSFFTAFPSIARDSYAVAAQFILQNHYPTEIVSSAGGFRVTTRLGGLSSFLISGTTFGFGLDFDAGGFCDAVYDMGIYGCNVGIVAQNGGTARINATVASTASTTNIMGCSFHGVSVGTGSTLAFVGNSGQSASPSIMFNGGQGMRVQNGHLHFTSACCRFNANYGLYVLDGGVASALKGVSTNLMEFNEDHGVYVDSGGTFSAEDIFIWGNGATTANWHGVRCQDGTVTLAGKTASCAVRGNQDSGVRVVRGAVVLDFVDLQANGDRGLSLLTGTAYHKSGSISNNTSGGYLTTAGTIYRIGATGAQASDANIGTPPVQGTVNNLAGFVV